MFRNSRLQAYVLRHGVECQFQVGAIGPRFEVLHQFDRRPSPAEAVLGPDVHNGQRVAVDAVAAAGRNVARSLADVEGLGRAERAVHRPRHPVILRRAQAHDVVCILGLGKTNHGSVTVIHDVPMVLAPELLM